MKALKSGGLIQLSSRLEPNRLMGWEPQRASTLHLSWGLAPVSIHHPLDFPVWDDGFVRGSFFSPIVEAYVKMNRLWADSRRSGREEQMKKRMKERIQRIERQKKQKRKRKLDIKKERALLMLMLSIVQLYLMYQARPHRQFLDIRALLYFFQDLKIWPTYYQREATNVHLTNQNAAIFSGNKKHSHLLYTY